MAAFVHEAEKFFKGKHQLDENEYIRFKQLIELRDGCWNKKAQEIDGRSLKKIAYDRASTAHQNGEKDATSLYEHFYTLQDQQEEKTKATKANQRMFYVAWNSENKEQKKKYKRFIKKVDEFHQMAQGQYPFEEIFN